jgi:hypothetical protein
MRAHPRRQPPNRPSADPLNVSQVLDHVRGQRPTIGQWFDLPAGNGSVPQNRIFGVDVGAKKGKRYAILRD